MDSTRIANLFEKINNIKVEIAKSGEEAMALWQENSYNSIILDYMLPDISAIELVKN